MKEITLSDLDDLALGAAVLGSGGGGDPTYQLMMAKQQVERFGPIPLVSPESLPDDALVTPVGFMGAPLVAIEKLPSGREFQSILKLLSQLKKRPPTHLIAAEIGGANALTPIIIAGEEDLPVIDGDTIGRAFPELQMSSCNLMGIKPCPAILADGLNRTVSVDVENAAQTERFCRTLTVEMGSSAAISIYPMNGAEARRAVIPGSVSRAIGIGRALREKGLEGLIQASDGTYLGEGIISDIDQVIQNGFLIGTVAIEGDCSWKVSYQNEYLRVTRENQHIASTPDIIVLLEKNSATPLSSESLGYGMRVQIISLPGPEIWYTEEGLKMVGPQYFGMEEK